MRNALPDSQRLWFRIWSQTDFALARSLWGDPEVTRLIDARGALSEGEVRDKLTEEIARQEQHGVSYWPVFQKATGEHVGCCGLRPYRLQAAIYEMGVHIRRAFWGQGLASEAARATIAYAFAVRGANALFAGHHPNNSVSCKLLLKLGFRYTHDELYPPTGLWHPSYLMTPEEHHAL